MRTARPGDPLVLGALLFLVAATVSVDPSLLRRGPPLDGEAEAVAAALSLSRDHDIAFDRDDLAAATAAFGAVPRSIVLVQRGEGGPLVYPRLGADTVLAAVAAKVVGASRAFPFVHALVLAFGLGLAWWRLGDGSLLEAGWWLTLALLGAVPIQVFRFTPEVTAFGLALAGLALGARGGRASRVVGGALVGVAVATQVGLTLDGDLMRFDERFPDATGAGAAAGQVLDTVVGPASGLVARLRGVVEIWIGRFGGVVATFPPLVVAAACIARSAERARVLSLCVFACAVSALAFASPFDYAGARDTFGVLAVVPLAALVVVAARGLATRRALWAAWILGGLFVLEPVVTPLHTVREPGLHARDWPHRWLPVERGRAAELPVLAPFTVDREDRVRLQYLDGNAYRPSGDCRNFATDDDTGPPLCFWTSRDREASMLLWTQAPLDVVTVRVRGAPASGGAQVRLGRDHRSVETLPATLHLEPGPGTRTVVDGREWLVQSFDVRAEREFQPRLEGITGDVRWLGVEVGVDLEGDRGETAPEGEDG